MGQNLLSTLISHPGVILSNDCSWSAHIKYVTEKAWKRIHVMRSLKFTLDRRSLETIYLSFIRPLLGYGDLIFDNLTNFDHNELDKIQNEAARIVTGTTKLTSIENLYTDTGWQPLGNRRKIHKLILMYKILYSQAPSYMYSLLPENNNARYTLRNSSHQRNVHARTNIF